MLCYLRFLANNGFYHLVGDAHGVSKSNNQRAVNAINDNFFIKDIKSLCIQNKRFPEKISFSKNKVMYGIPVDQVSGNKTIIIHTALRSSRSNFSTSRCSFRTSKSNSLLSSKFNFFLTRAILRRACSVSVLFGVSDGF